MTEDLWTPWRVSSSLPPSLRRVEMLRQQVAVHDLLGTTLPRHIRDELRDFEQRLADELANDNKRSDHEREGKATAAAE